MSLEAPQQMQQAPPGPQPGSPLSPVARQQVAGCGSSVATVPRPSTSMSRLPALRGGPQGSSGASTASSTSNPGDSPPPSRGGRSPSAAAARSLNALLLGSPVCSGGTETAFAQHASRASTPSSSAPQTPQAQQQHHQQHQHQQQHHLQQHPHQQQSQQWQQELGHGQSGQLSEAPTVSSLSLEMHDPVAIRAAAAELAERHMAEALAEQQRQSADGAADSGLPDLPEWPSAQPQHQQPQAQQQGLQHQQHVPRPRPPMQPPKSDAASYQPAASAAAARHMLAPSAEDHSGLQSDNVLALKLTVVSGPSTDVSYTTAKDTQQVVVGRLSTNTLALDDSEVSGTHLILRWLDPEDGSPCCWQVADAGSLNGTLLNGTRISIAGRRRGAAYRLNSDDLLQLGTSTAIKVSYLPRELLDQKLVAGPPQLRRLSGVNAPPPPIQRTPSRDGIHRAPAPPGAKPAPMISCPIDLPDLHVTGYAVSRVGREHERRSQVCEDVIRWVPDLLPVAPKLQRSSASLQRRSERALLRTTTCEASPALQQFLALYGSGGSDGSPPPWGGTAERGTKLPAQTAAHTDKWSPQPEPRGRAEGVDSPLTEPASSSRPSLDDGGTVSMDADHSFNSRAAAVFEKALQQAESSGGTRRDSNGSSRRDSSGSTRRGSGGLGRLGSLAASSGGRDDFGDEQPLAALFCVFDGHCGRLAAEQAARLLPRELADRIDPRQLLQRHPPNAGVWEQAFAATDQGLECEDGCTATAALAWLDEAGALNLQTANVGDSSGVWITTRPGAAPQVTALTSDHRWNSETERARLAAMGIQLEGRTRLYGLNLSRCLGDKFLKDEDLGLSCQPSTSAIVRLEPGDAGGVLLLASDGLWDVADVASVANVAMRFLPDGPQAAAEALLQLAHAQRSRDDVSVVLLHVQP